MRSTRRITVVLGAAALAAATLARVATPAVLMDPGCGETVIVQRADLTEYRLPHGFIRPGSDSVWTRRGPWRRGVDYALDRTRGALRVLGLGVAGDTLWVSACWLLAPPPFELQLQSYRPARAPGDTLAPDSLHAPPVPRPITARLPSEAPAGTSLSLSGNKSVAVDFGSSQDAFLRQSLDLALSGTLAPGVELTGVLSDRNTPLSATGSTQDLQSLDRVLLELRAPQGGASLGDISLDLSRGEFGRIDRRLQGVSGTFGGGGFQGIVAAASARGEFNSVQFFGVEGRQGPYQLTDREGNAAISVVAGSEVVTLDGERLTRGESADYSMDYERGRLTFTNRRPVSSASRITVDYQFAVNRFRRNLAAVGGGWERGPWRAFTTFLTEGDDRGRPVDQTLDATDRVVLALAGDSLSRAVGSGVTPGRGDYNLVAGDSTTTYFAFAGPDSGLYAVRFTQVGQGHGDYADSAVVSGRTTYRFVGHRAGAYEIGRSLPLPDSHQLWSVGGGMHAGPLSVDLEGAISRHDLNTFSSLDDGDNLGQAGNVRLGLEGQAPGPWGGRAGLTLVGRTVATRFDPFTRLERPFANEDWGLGTGADLEHQSRVELSGFWSPRVGGDLRGTVGRLTTPGGFQSLRRTLEWSRDGVVTTRALWERADGEQASLRFSDGGREHRRAELGLRLPWLEPLIRAETDERRSPSDSARVGNRFRELAGLLQSPRALPWRGHVSYVVRRDAQAVPSGFADQSEARTMALGLDSPEGGGFGAALAWQRRLLEPLADQRRTRSDLATARLRAADNRHGLSGLFNLEVTSEGENRRTRVLTFVGHGQGAYDSLGNFIGTGDYNLVLEISPTLDRVARAATGARAAWQFGSSEAWRGSRVEFNFESEARRLGDLRGTDVLLAPGAALGSGALARGSVVQRLESELAPGSRAGALRFRFERRVSADRSYENFAQTVDERNASARWRTRPAAAWTSEVEGRWKRQEAGQDLTGTGGYRRTLVELGGTGQIVFAPDPRFRTAMALETAWARPEESGTVPVEYTRTVRVGPDVGLSVGKGGHVELSARRGFQSGPPAVSLLPTADPAGAARWEGTARLDYRVRESTTLGTSFSVRDRPERGTEYTGRAELRAFF